MRIRTRAVRVAVAAACVALSVAACTSPSDTSSKSSASAVPSGVPAGEPDVNGDGKVTVGVLSPGDLNDNGYYESFVAKAETFTKAKGWKLIKVGSINP